MNFFVCLGARLCVKTTKIEHIHLYLKIFLEGIFREHKLQESRERFVLKGAMDCCLEIGVLSWYSCGVIHF